MIDDYRGRLLEPSMWPEYVTISEWYHVPPDGLRLRSATSDQDSGSDSTAVKTVDSQIANAPPFSNVDSEAPVV